MEVPLSPAEPVFRQRHRTHARAGGREDRIRHRGKHRRQRRFAEAGAESLAGYEILAKQTNPAIGFLQNARKDLVAEYDSLGQPERGARFRAELAAESIKAVAKAK